MRNFNGGVSVETVGGDTLRLLLSSPTGEKVYHDLTPAEAEAIRKALPEPPTSNQDKRRFAGKEK